MKKNTKSRILYINRQGEYIESQINHLDLCTQTSNGIFVKLSPHSQNYKEGYLTFHYHAAHRIVSKMIQTLSTAESQDRPVNYTDLSLLEFGANWQTLKK